MTATRAIHVVAKWDANVSAIRTFRMPNRNSANSPSAAQVPIASQFTAWENGSALALLIWKDSTSPIPQAASRKA